MAIYPALYSWLVGPGLPLDHLYFKRLPKDNPTGKDVVVAVILAPGSREPEKHIGRRDLADQGDSITDDGGILWVSTGLLFQVRADKGFEVMADHVINRVMRRMLMIQGERVLPEATDVEPFSTWEATFGIRLERERLFYVELIDSPSDEEQDTKERIVTRLEMDVRHYAVPLPLQAAGTLTGSLTAVLDGRASYPEDDGGATGAGGASGTRSLAVGWSPDPLMSAPAMAAANFDEDEDGAVVIPDETGGSHLYIWRSDEAGGDPTAVSVGSALNWRNIFGPAVPMDFEAVPGQVVVTVVRQNAGLLSGETVEVE